MAAAPPLGDTIVQKGAHGNNESEYHSDHQLLLVGRQIRPFLPESVC